MQPWTLSCVIIQKRLSPRLTLYSPTLDCWLVLFWYLKKKIFSELKLAHILSHAFKVLCNKGSLTKQHAPFAFFHTQAGSHTKNDYQPDYHCYNIYSSGSLNVLRVQLVVLGSSTILDFIHCN